MAVVLECVTSHYVTKPLTIYNKSYRFYEDLMLQTDKDFVTVYPGGILHILEFSRKLEGLYKCLATTTADFLELEFRLTLAEPCDLCTYVFYF